MRNPFINTDVIHNLEDAYVSYDEQAVWIEAAFQLPEMRGWFLRNDFPENAKQLARWEYEVSLFDFKGETIFGHADTSSVEGVSATTFPDINKFTKDSWEYFRGRAVTNIMKN